VDYDELLTKELEGVYDFLDAATGLWSRSRTAQAASKLHTVLLDVNELTEGADNAIKFLSDMFSGRLYKLAASKVGVPDYKDLVKEKLQTAEDLYRFMVDQFSQSRAFVEGPPLAKSAKDGPPRIRASLSKGRPPAFRTRASGDK
jgi:hypothetical protein